LLETRNCQVITDMAKSLNWLFSVYMFIKKVSFLEGRLLSSQPERFKKLWLAEKIRPSKRALCFWNV